MARLLHRREEMPGPVIEVEAALCVETFRPGAVARMIERGERLPLDHQAVRSFPQYFRGLVQLPIEEIENE
jgi:hypothetical protein